MTSAGDGHVLRMQATCVRWHGRGWLIVGPSGSGKSSLAAQMMGAGAHLVADDALLVIRHHDRLRAAELPEIDPGPGLIELHGSGIFNCVNSPTTSLHYGVRTVSVAPADRLPDDSGIELLGVPLPTVSLSNAGSSTVARLLLAASACRVA